MGGVARVVVFGPTSWNHLILLDSLPEPRAHTRFAEDAWWTVGGTSAGKALHLAALGADVTLVSPLADDAAGARIREALRDTPLTCVWLPSDVTESHTNLMTSAGQRLSLYTAVPSEPPPAELAAALTLVQGADAVVADLCGWNAPALALARTAGAPVWVDLHDYDGASAFHVPYARAASAIVMNDDGMPAPLEYLDRCVADGATLGIVTLGAAGAAAVDATGRHHAPAVPTEVIDTNGAGDAFAAGALMAWLSGEGTDGVLAAGTRQAATALTTRDLGPLLD